MTGQNAEVREVVRVRVIVAGQLFVDVEERGMGRGSIASHKRRDTMREESKY